MNDVNAPSDLLATLEYGLHQGRTSLEAAAGSAPTGVDAGLMSPLIAGMLARVMESAGAASEALAIVGSEVSAAGHDFWSTDADQVTTYASGRAPLVD